MGGLQAQTGRMGKRRTLAIGDIHGCFQALTALENFVPFQPTDRTITLGDHVNRGPDSRSFLEWLIARAEQGNLIALRGNHELMTCAAKQSPRTLASGLHPVAP